MKPSETSGQGNSFDGKCVVCFCVFFLILFIIIIIIIIIIFFFRIFRQWNAPRPRILGMIYEFKAYKSQVPERFGADTSFDVSQ